jgi:hypothetical protein
VTPVASPDPFVQEEQRANNRLAELEHERANPWGTPNNHPGTLGKIGHVLGTIGNVAGAALSPEITANIPGSALNRGREVNQNRKALLGAAEGEEKSALAKKAEQPAEKYSWHYQDDQGNEFGVRPDGSVEKMSEPGKKTKESPEKNFQQVQYSNDKGVNQVGFIDPENKLWTEENSKGKIDPTTGKEPVVGEPRVIGHAQGKTSATKEAATTLMIPGKGKVAGKIDSKGNLMVAGVNGEPDTPAPAGTLIYRPPSYAETMPATRTQIMIDPDTGVASTYSWNAETGKYDIKQGVAGGGQEGSKIAQAAVVTRAGNDLISDIQANAKSIDKTKLGDWLNYVKQYGLDSPVADPTLARLQSEFMSFAALNPAMHGYRSVDAMHAFERMVGGLQKNPEAAIESIKGILQTAGEFNPQPKAGAKPDKVLEKGPDGKLRFKSGS